MVNTSLKRRRTEAEMRKGMPKKEKKKVKRQKYYHSSDDESGDEHVATDAPKNYKAPRTEEVEEVFEPSGANAVEARSKPAKSKPLKSALKTQPKHKMSIPAKTAPDPAHDSSPSEEEEEEEEDEEEDSEMEAEADDFDISDSDSDISSTAATAHKVKKRNDPTAFATSISRILATKLTSSKRSEPILSRSKDAQTAHKELSDLKLNERARRQIVAEKRAAREKGRVKDVLGLNNNNNNDAENGGSTAQVTAKEKELRRTAQKGVIRLFNAVRAAQVKGEAAQQLAREQNVVGMGKREDKVKEMSKQGFLDMIAGGQKVREGSVEA